MTATKEKSEPIPSLKVNFPDRNLRDRFKAACALNGKNMNEVIIEFVHHYVEENDPTQKAS
ncbi:plasmid partition protein ParG [Anabaena cylindrica UHCC 0172]|uniref:plasmid partition protein ParG n=1 Tax=Anabaena cylindrica TaxID=1165 RepID=UPI002B1F8F85|nr:plasmid partition protein ParG [Anabaena cylindrica]MEA5551782.1 plasmid partition protein ParG [Anabaena cylindrica UHCC 0172]